MRLSAEVSRFTVAAAAPDRQRNVARVTALAHLTSSQTERRALFEGAPLGAIGALIQICLEYSWISPHLGPHPSTPARAGLTLNSAARGA